jgi:hypothetical protein
MDCEWDSAGSLDELERDIEWEIEGDDGVTDGEFGSLEVRIVCEFIWDWEGSGEKGEGEWLEGWSFEVDREEDSRGYKGGQDVKLIYWEESTGYILNIEY